MSISRNVLKVGRNERSYGLGHNPNGGRFTEVIHADGSISRIYDRRVAHVDGKYPCDGGYNTAELADLAELIGLPRDTAPEAVITAARECAKAHAQEVAFSV